MCRVPEQFSCYLTFCCIGAIIISILQRYAETYWQVLKPGGLTPEVVISKVYITNHWSVGKRLSEKLLTWGQTLYHIS